MKTDFRVKRNYEHHETLSIKLIKHISPTFFPRLYFPRRLCFLERKTTRYNFHQMREISRQVSTCGCRAIIGAMIRCIRAMIVLDVPGQTAVSERLFLSYFLVNWKRGGWKYYVSANAYAVCSTTSDKSMQGDETSRNFAPLERYLFTHASEAVMHYFSFGFLSLENIRLRSWEFLRQ